jgi:hypothetical protein
VALPAYRDSFGSMPFALDPIAEFFAERLDDLRPLFVHPVPKRVALQERAALPGVMAAVKEVLGAIPELEVVELAGRQHAGEPPLGPAEVQGRVA